MNVREFESGVMEAHTCVCVHVGGWPCGYVSGGLSNSSLCELCIFINEWFAVSRWIVRIRRAVVRRLW